MNEWTHLAWTLTQTSDTTGMMRFYQNGQLKFSKAMTDDHSYMRYSRTWRFGSGGDGPPNGTLDSYRIYAQPLNASQIAADMALN
ncbi:hypothetical protein B7Z28_02230 [Candidatus Saccharibacteria bacterium 32-45-3]|nr:MAG: hypothetical protein B7Z28_02230 [Candidatus Saccharibacteria bacterium 32-45-3]